NTGDVSGTPTTPGTYIFEITAEGSTGCGTSQIYVIAVGCPAIAVFPLAIPNGVTGQMVDLTLTANGGSGPYAFSYSGVLPPGLNLSNNGKLTGTPTLAGSYSIVVIATDSTGCIGSTPYTITIDCPSIDITPAALPDGTASLFYNQQLSANGGTAPY